MSGDVVVFVPCRAGSTRVARKNTRPFADVPGGLLELKLRQLSGLEGVARVVVDSNDPEVLDFSRAYARRWSGPSELLVRERPDALGRPDTRTDDLVAYAIDTLAWDHLLWTHVTSPFADRGVYRRALARYARALEQGWDSLMSVLRIQGFLFDAGGAPLYDRFTARWPRTQDMTPVFEADSAVFLVPRAAAERSRDRIGERPFLMELSQTESIDIDWEPDFEYAASLYRHRQELAPVDQPSRCSES